MTAESGMELPVHNQADTCMPDLLICRKEHADVVFSLVRELATP